MFCQITLLFESIAAFVTLKWSLPCVRSHVVLQITSRFASVVAIVTLVRLLPFMVRRCVLLQIISSFAGILVNCASVRLFSRVGSFVTLQRSCLNC